MKFSVLMSLYFKDDPNHFEEAFRSISEYQTLKPNEIILIVDGPIPDKLRVKVEEFKKNCSYLKVYYLQQNKGLGNALNYGLQQCSYDFVARMDSDDVSVHNRFEKQVNYLITNPDIVVLGSYITEFNTTIVDDNQLKKVPLSSSEIEKLLKTRNPLNHMTVIFNRQKILDIGSYHNVSYVEDYELWIRCVIEGYHIENLPESLVYARIGNGMLKRRSNRAYISSWYSINLLMLKNRLIGRLELLRNMFLIISFIYMPIFIKNFMYRIYLRT